MYDSWLTLTFTLRIYEQQSDVRNAWYKNSSLITFTNYSVCLLRCDIRLLKQSVRMQTVYKTYKKLARQKRTYRLMESDNQSISFIVTIISQKCRQHMLWFNFCTDSFILSSTKQNQCVRSHADMGYHAIS